MGLDALGEVIGHQEDLEMLFELAMRPVVVAVDGRVLQSVIHSLDLAVGDLTEDFRHGELESGPACSEAELWIAGG